MKDFYFVDAQGVRRGPVPAQNLAQHGVKGDTLVWCEGMPDWKPAVDVPELKSVLFTVPPVVPGAVPPVMPSMQPVTTQPNNYLWLAIASTVLCCLPLGIVAIVYSTKVDPLWRDGDYAGAKANADKAKMWTMISAGVGLVCSILGFFIGVLSSL